MTTLRVVAGILLLILSLPFMLGAKLFGVGENISGRLLNVIEDLVQ